MSQTEMAAVRLPAASSTSGGQPMGWSSAAPMAAAASASAPAERLSTTQYCGPSGRETVSPVLPKANAACIGTSSEKLLVGQRGHSRQGLAFEKLQRGAAAGGDVGDLVRNSSLLDCGNRIPAAHDAGGIVVGRHKLGDGVGAVRKRRKLEDSHGAVPQNGARVGDLFGE